MSISIITYADLLAERDRLAAEVDELRGKLDDVRMGIGCARGQRTTQFCAEAAQRDQVITKMLEMLMPKFKPTCHADAEAHMMRHVMPILHARALEIAGRAE